MLLTTSEIIEQSWGFYLKNWKRLRLYVLFLFLPTVVLIILDILGLYLDTAFPASVVMSNIIIVLLYLLSVLFSLWAGLALAQVINRLLDGHIDSNWQLPFNVSLPMVWPMIYTSILVGLVVLGGTLLFIIPGLIFTVWYGFAVYAVMFDDARGLAAMRLSKRLVVGRWWACVWRLFLPSSLFVMVAVLIRTLVLLPFEILISSELVSNFLTSTVVALINALVMPLSLAAVIILYRNLKATPVAPTPKLVPPSSIQ